MLDFHNGITISTDVNGTHYQNSVVQNTLNCLKNRSTEFRANSYI